jgi:hypothetical protein
MRSISSILILASLLALATVASAGDEAACGDKSCKAGHGCKIVRCPQCCHDCVFSAEKDKETRTCYTAECKPICIPRVVFPWQSGCCTCGKGDKDGKDGCCAIHNGVKKRSVRVLKKYEYECSKCKYQWNVVDDKDGYKADKALEPQVAPAADPTVPPPPPISAQHQPQGPAVRIAVR